MPSLSPSIILAIVLELLLAASGALAAQPAPTLETIDGRQVESLTIRQPAAAAPVVVFEAGSRGTLERWGRVPGLVGREATVFAYNRPGYGNSAAAASPRDGRTIVEELRRILRHKGLPPPYLLVGHSLGGLYMQLFARAYPQEVRGLVLIDALYPRMVKKTAEFPLLTRLAGRLAFSRTVWQEIDKIDETGEAVLALGGIDDKPIVQLVNVPAGNTAIPVDFGAFRMDAATRQLVRGLYPHAQRVVVDASHQMPLTSPEVVAGAILGLVAAARPCAGCGETASHAHGGHDISTPSP
jgi:pimeloyl-ACP methyl ester carboxylesterase